MASGGSHEGNKKIDFNETEHLELNSLGTFSFNITVEYGETYTYRIKAIGTETGYSNTYTNEYIAFFTNNTALYNVSSSLFVK